MSLPHETQHCRGCSCSDATTPARDIQQLVDLVKTANDATAAMAEVARVQGHAILTAIRRDNPRSQTANPALASAHTSTRSGMVISERVGSISVEQWEQMSESSLRDLDRVLMKIINTTMVQDINWMQSGVAIHRDLAAVGLVFKTEGECLPSDVTRDWAVAENMALPDIVRMRAVASASRMFLDEAACTRWWVDEMVRIVVRLMELRGT